MAQFPLIYWGAITWLLGIATYTAGVLLSIVRLAVGLDEPLRQWNAVIIWYSGVPTTIGLLLVAADLALLLPRKRRFGRRVDAEMPTPPGVTVALTAYNDEKSIADSVEDFRRHPLVKRVIVVSNKSTDRTEAEAYRAGAIVLNEPELGYGHCVCRCLEEALKYEDSHIVLCEGDRTFRARDLDKLLAYQPHADIVNGTRIVEQLRAYSTQLTTLMYYGNFFVGKLLELKHFGRGTDCVLDLGCGYGDFINCVAARRRIAVDAWAGVQDHLDDGVECHVGPATDLAFIEPGSVNLAVASNLFEHVSQEAFRVVLHQLMRVLAPGGSLVIIQPNYYYAYRRYFDDYTHVTVYSHVSLCDLLRAEGYDILKCAPRFLPLSIRSRLPVHPALIGAYLASPWKPLAGQMLVQCRPGSGQ
jgi:SAM-dependent methyltransferase